MEALKDGCVWRIPGTSTSLRCLLNQNWRGCGWESERGGLCLLSYMARGHFTLLILEFTPWDWSTSSSAGMTLLMRIFSGWWLSHPSEKYEFVSWDDYSQYMEKPPTSFGIVGTQSSNKPRCPFLRQYVCYALRLQTTTTPCVPGFRTIHCEETPTFEVQGDLGYGVLAVILRGDEDSLTTSTSSTHLMEMPKSEFHHASHWNCHKLWETAISGQNPNTILSIF